ncbi:MAG: aldo/keto reductase [Acidobacteria bacterium]|nr:aldo/keto reductase [Acidobacteriota bacterium]
MRKIRLGRTEEHVSAISLGTWGHGGTNVSNGNPVGWSGHDDAEARRAILTAFEHGIDHWDTADVYGDGNAERLIGTVWDEIDRDQVFLATKVGWDRGGHDRYYHPDLIRDRLGRSLSLLNTDHIDLYYFHHCDFGPDDRYLYDAIEVFAEAKEQGKIRWTGLSDWDGSKIVRLIDTIGPDVVQPFRNVVDDDWESSGLRRAVEDRDLGVAFFSPLKHGLLLGKYDEPTSFPEGDFRDRIEEFADASFISRMKKAKRAVEDRFAGVDQPVLHALVGALLEDAPTACVLLGQRNEPQALAAAAVGEALSHDDAEWVRRVYRSGL